MRKSKNKSKKFLPRIFTLLLSLLREPQSPTVLLKQLPFPCSKQRLNYYLKKAFNKGLVEKQRLGRITLYKLTPLGEQFLKDSKKFLVTYEEKKFIQHVRIHHLAIKIPIEIDNPRLNVKKKNPLKNWTEQYFKIEGLRVTIKKTTKHIIVYFHEFKIPASQKFMLNIMLYLAKYLNALKERLWHRYKILVDISKATIQDQHLANYLPVLNEIAKKTTSKQSRITVYLGREATSLFGEPIKNKEAWALIDWSKSRETGMPEIETNDLLYEEKLLLMPEMIWALDRKLTPAINWLAQNLRKHEEVLNRMNENQKKFNELLEKLLERLEKYE